MKVRIISADRVGISQEVLSVVAKHQWNVVAMEVVSKAIYLHLDIDALLANRVVTAFSLVKGVTTVEEINVLPRESKEQHLSTLLARLPNPIFDVDSKGRVISSNQEQAKVELLTSIFDLLSIEASDLIGEYKHVETNYQGQPFIAEVSPVTAKGSANGAVIVLKAMKALGKQLAFLQQDKNHQIDNIIGESSVVKALKEQLAKFAKLELPILLTGETGTGKELFARAIHEGSDRRHAPFLAINCASLSEQLLESELFGYAAGAFTGAHKAGKPGLFELAEGGTVFLDEVAEMSSYLQAKLLRFLQDYHYRRVGGTKEYIANIRIISASHQLFPELLKKKLFREDLYYRLNVLNLALPSLNERTEDIPLLVNYFLIQASAHLEQEPPEISESAMTFLVQASWPGNIRQLQNVIFRLVALNSGENITAQHVSGVLSGFEAVTENKEQRKDWLSYNDWHSAQEAFEKQLLTQFLPLYPSTRKLAQRLGVSHNKIAMKLRKINAQ